jgi:hypothetical protein
MDKSSLFHRAYFDVEISLGMVVGFPGLNPLSRLWWVGCLQCLQCLQCIQWPFGFPFDASWPLSPIAISSSIAPPSREPPRGDLEDIRARGPMAMRRIEGANLMSILGRLYQYTDIDIRKLRIEDMICPCMAASLPQMRAVSLAQPHNPINCYWKDSR